MWWPLFEYSTGYLNGMGYSLDVMMTGMLALSPILTVAAIVAMSACGVEAECSKWDKIPDSKYVASL